jgi:hypothetical protein
MLVKITKTLAKLLCNVTNNIISSLRLIAYRCLISDNLQDRIDLKKRFLDDQMVT